jgi:hypothetical protein
MIQMIGEGSVGPEIATLFTTFIANKLDKMISPKEILTKASWEDVKSDLVDLFYSGGDYKGDIASIMATRLVNYTMYYSEHNSIDAKIIKRLENIITDGDIFKADLIYYIVRQIINGNRIKFQGLLMNAQIVKLTIK